MKTFDGYLKLKFGDTYLLLAGGGEKKLTDLLTLFERPANTNNILLTVGGTLLTVSLGARAFDSTAYLPLAGGTMTGTLTIKTGGIGNYDQGIRINRFSTNSWALLMIGKSGNNTTGTGTSTAGDGAWLIGTPASSNSLVFNLNDATESKGLCLKGHGTNDIKWNNKTIYHAGNLSTFVKSGSTAAAGLVPKPDTTAGTGKFLCEDGTWSIPAYPTKSSWNYDDVYTKKTQSIPVIVGPSTDTTAGTWTGTTDAFTAYADGITIIYVPAVAGANPTTLNINGLGAKTCYFTNTSKLTTHFAVGTPIMFTYYGNKWMRADYDSNSNTQYYLTLNGTVNGNSGKTNLGTIYAPTSAGTGFLKGTAGSNGTITWSWDNSTYNNYSLPTASNSALGGVKTGAAVTDTTGMTAVHIKDGVIYYKDTNTWKAANTSQEGYAPKLATGGGTIATQSTEYVLTFKSGTDTAPVWRLLPANAYKNDNTWKLANTSQEGYVPKSVANKILRANGSGVLYWGDDANTTYTFYNLLFQNSGGTTVDTYKPTTSPTKTLKAGSNVTISAASNVITIASTNTWTAWAGATSSANGTPGYMPAPTSAQRNQFLRGDGSWVSLNNYSLPARLAETITANTAQSTYNGFGRVASNGPFSGISGSGADCMTINTAYNTSWAGELATDYRTSNIAYRAKKNGTWTDWAIMLSNKNSSVTKSGETLTVNLLGSSLSITNTWRGIQDNLTSSSATTLSLSAKQGYLLANGSARDNTKLFAFNFGGTGSTTKIKININATNGYMISFVVTIYQGYRSTKVMVSGYNYGSNHWYSPKAVILGDTSSTTIKVYFGYDAVNKLWVGFDGGSYTGVCITDVCNGYSQISSFAGLFTISNVSELGGTTQTTITPVNPYVNTWNANAVGVAGYVAAPTKAANANMVWKTDSDGNPAWRADANSDTQVTQAASDTSNWRKVLLHYSSDPAYDSAVTKSTNTVYAAIGVSVLPSTGTLRAAILDGSTVKGTSIYLNGTALSTAATHAHGDYVTAIGTSRNTLTWSKGGTAQTAITIPYATSAGSLGSYVKPTSAGSLSIFPTGGSYRDGIRIHARTSDNGWAAVLLCGADNTGDSGTSANSWFIGANSGNFYIGRNGTGGGGTYLRCVDNVWTWNGTASANVSYADSAGSATNVTGTVAIANGGTGASTRLNALKNLTNENVSTNAQYFLTITSSWDKGGYTSVADAKTVLAMTGATSSANGTAGVVSAPPKDGYNTKFLRADGTWSIPAYPTKSSWNYDDVYVKSVSISENHLRVTKNGSNSDLTIPYATSAGSATTATRFEYITNWSSPKKGTNTINLMTDNSASATTNGAPSSYTSGISIVTTYVGFQLAVYGGGGDTLYFRKLQDNNTWHDWKTIYHSGNLPAYPTKSSWNYDDRYVSSLTTSGNYLRWVKNGTNNDITIPYATNADTVDGEHASAFAHIGAHNNLTASGNEFTFASSAFSGAIWINYRTAGGLNGNITQYVFGNGQGGSLASITSGTFNGNCTGSAGSVAWGNVSSKPTLYINNYLPENTPHYFRDPNNGSWRGGMYWGSAGSESMSFVVLSSSTRFLFVIGSDIASWGSSTWLSASCAMYITSSGVYALNFYSTSDRSKKQNISSFSEHIRKFQLKDTEKYAYGVIAQEVPEMFRDGEEGNMTVNYNSILSYYIGELENKVQKLEDEIKQLKENNKWLH